MPALPPNFKTALTYRLIDSDNVKTELSTVIDLLLQIQQTGNLRTAAEVCGFSYRKAWDLIKTHESLFRKELVIKHRGKGSQLTGFSTQLLALLEQQQVALAAALSLSERQINQWLVQSLTELPLVRMVASDSEILNHAHQAYPDLFQLQIAGSLQALSAYRDKQADMAGFHLPIGPLGLGILHDFKTFLAETDQFLVLESRQQGIISHPERPVLTIEQIAEQSLNFVNRQKGSGTRTLFDQILTARHIRRQQISGYHHEQHTHLAVAGLIASRQADAGLGVYQVAKRLGLHFSALCEEYYFLVFPESFFQSHKSSDLFNKLNINDESELLSYTAFISLCENTTTSI